MTFDHNDIGRPNGNYFALPYESGEADIEIISVPWDVTTSYRSGTAQGPQAIIEASAQVDLFDFERENAWTIRIAGTKLDLADLNVVNRALAEKIIAHLEAGGKLDDKEIAEALSRVNRASETMNDLVYDAACKILNQNKFAAVVGGEHSTPFGLIKALAERNPAGMGILQIDAHADLRCAYEGFLWSHASIMYNVLHRTEGVEKLVQVAIRDLCDEEIQLAERCNKIVMFPDRMLKTAEFTGKTWHEQCTEIISNLPQNVYISFDIDGLSPSLCPGTGTPVPGGLSFPQAAYLIRQLAKSKKTIIGFDLNEVAPAPTGDWDANVGARMLFELCCSVSLNRGI
ncbi:MAG: agmatinase family protein [Prevotellaceae bacterium]|jgi:agmatinase|nr:agmatinase family protein [Prevotellaceae bacterium]